MMLGLSESYSTSGTFITAFMLLGPDAAQLEYLERNCVGWYLREAAGP